MEEVKEKIYCKKCKYISNWDFCNAPDNLEMIDDWDSKYQRRKEYAYTKNKHNDCTSYKKRFNIVESIISFVTILGKFGRAA